MLASDDESGTLATLKFSLASDIVELLVLTVDDVFLQTLREAVGGARRLWHVPSADKVSDLLVAGEVGIVVIDVLALGEVPSVFITQIKRQFPELVVVVAGNREAEISLGGLISNGTVYRFIHKPMSPGRAKLFAEAAVKKYEEQRRRAAETPPRQIRAGQSYAWIVGGGALALCTLVLAAWLLHRNSGDEDDVPAAPDKNRAGTIDSPLLARAAAALSANHLTEPAGENALELYLQANARNPADPTARTGLAEVHERLLARAENALLEERLDEAAAAIETARKSGVENGRIAFLTAQLAKSRERVKSSPGGASRTRGETKPAAEDHLTPLLTQFTQRMDEGRLIEPERDSARFYLDSALKLDPGNTAVAEARHALGVRILAEARNAIDRRDFVHGAAWIDAAKGIAESSNIETSQSLLSVARHQADTAAWSALLRNANERMQQDRLIEPPNDNAKYYLLTLRDLDPGNAGLAPAMQDLGTRLIAKARRALALEQFDATRSWMLEAAAIGFTSTDFTALEHDLDVALAKQNLPAEVSSGQLTLLKSSAPSYPKKAQQDRVEGWVELDFTVSDTGQVKELSVHASNPHGVFEDAALKAVTQWRYQPVLRDAKAIAVRTRLRIRFTLP